MLELIVGQYSDSNACVNLVDLANIKDTPTNSI